MPTLAAAAAASGESCECVRLINRVQGIQAAATKIKARFLFYISWSGVEFQGSRISHRTGHWTTRESKQKTTTKKMYSGIAFCYYTCGVLGPRCGRLRLQQAEASGGAARTHHGLMNK
jgi:hypothetical protein